MTDPAHSLAFVTGTTSGIGEALARDLLGRGWLVVGAARRAGTLTDSRYVHLQVDLGNLVSLRDALDRRLLPLMSDPGLRRVGLVNNAALVGLLGPVSQLDADALAPIYAVNVAAPILLMGWLQQHMRPSQPLRIVNVSSAAAVMPLAGLGAYGSAKAALRMAGMILAAELDLPGSSLASLPDTSILSFEPGVVDTPMQTTVRTTSIETMPLVQMFKDFAESGALVPAILPARAIADYLSADGHARWTEHRFEPL